LSKGAVLDELFERFKAGIEPMRWPASWARCISRSSLGAEGAQDIRTAIPADEEPHCLDEPARFDPIFIASAVREAPRVECINSEQGVIMHAQANGEKVSESAIEPLLRMPTVRRLTGNLGRSTIYKMVAEDRFPKPVRTGSRAVAWRESDVRRWIEARLPAH